MCVSAWFFMLCFMGTTSVADEDLAWVMKVFEEALYGTTPAFGNSTTTVTSTTSPTPTKSIAEQLAEMTWPTAPSPWEQGWQDIQLDLELATTESIQEQLAAITIPLETPGMESTTAPPTGMLRVKYPSNNSRGIVGGWLLMAVVGLAYLTQL
ncbi:hypothetical protein FOL47_009709 [Perkinsus chesapeaki]|uniref:Uncharacterized protein n=1 Tax=Perkinsus chesapeaki TaxID=330153 RepID=A0A7J6L6R1_PERCH|nr:hypothetical protein FOL47_009709 [Perkinsus chesapeaki]